MSKTYKLKSRRRKLIAKQKRVWMGLDVHKKKFSVVILDRHEVLHRATLPMDKKHVQALLGRLIDCDIEAVFEAGPTGYTMLRWLREYGCDAFMCAPSMVPTRTGDRIKTDRRDALKLARCLRGQMLDPIWDLSDEAYQWRELLRTRKQIVEHRTRVAQQIKSKLLFHGIDRPEGLKANWSKAYLEWLEQGPSGRAHLDWVLAELVDTWRHLTEKIRTFDRQVDELASSEPFRDKVELLRTVPGVGVLTAMTFLVELDNLDRFETCEEFSSYLGLVPREDSTGANKRKGKLTRTGNKRVRTALVEASWQAIGQDERLRQVYDRIKYRNTEGGAGIAVVAVARRLGLAMRAMLRDGQPYQMPSP